jgi:hypothetical protein
MKTIQIYIYDLKKAEENESIGFEKNKDLCNVAELNFNESALSGFWLDPEVDEDTLSQNIIFYLHGTSFTAPYTKQNYELLRSCMK